MADPTGIFVFFMSECFGVHVHLCFCQSGFLMVLDQAGGNSTSAMVPSTNLYRSNSSLICSESEGGNPDENGIGCCYPQKLFANRTVSLH